MSRKRSNYAFWHALPIIGFFVSEWEAWQKERALPRYRLVPFSNCSSALPPYPLDMWFQLDLPLGALDEAGVPYNVETEQHPGVYHPTTIAQYALAHWNGYLATGNEKHRRAFMLQARWLVDHETRFANEGSGWTIPFANSAYHAPTSWRSAMTQGEGISVLVRAYCLTGETDFLKVARRAIRPFEIDIRDGGVSATIGDDGIFFEEVAVDPAAHILNGYFFALFGLYDYVSLTHDIHIAKLIERSHITLHTFIDSFDTGYWSRYDLLNGHLATQFNHSLHAQQFEVLAQYTKCKLCSSLARRWARYQQGFLGQLRYFIGSRIIRSRRVGRFITCFRWVPHRVFSRLVRLT